ncbi:MAG TPA: hypothetical protein K8W04_11370 [Bacteroides reticulotermitis]|nr:hypothetical protein [Bacteroides reticulotermitis]
MNENYINIQMSNLVAALVRNINDNFINISFDVAKNGCVQVRIILEEHTAIEEEYIEDIAGEFTASQKFDILEEVEIVVNKDIGPLRYIVFNRK